MSEPRKPTTRPALLDAPIKRKTKKSAYLRKLERQQREFAEVKELARQYNDERSARVREAAERALLPRSRRPLPNNVTRLKP